MGMMDDLMRRLRGTPAVDERAEREAERLLSDAASDRSAPARFGLAMADKLETADDRGLRGAFHEMGRGDAIPVQGVTRRARIYETARDAAAEYVEKGDNAGLGNEMGRAARTDALTRVAGLSSSCVRGTGVDDLLHGLTRETGMEVRRYLDGHGVSSDMIGKAAEKVGRGSADESRLFAIGREFDMVPPPATGDRSSWMRSAMLFEQGMARAGILRPDEIVAVATSNIHADPRREAMDARADVSMPNFARGQSVERGTAAMREMAIRHSGVTERRSSKDIAQDAREAVAERSSLSARVGVAARHFAQQAGMNGGI